MVIITQARDDGLDSDSVMVKMGKKRLNSEYSVGLPVSPSLPLLVCVYVCVWLRTDPEPHAC